MKTTSPRARALAFALLAGTACCGLAAQPAAAQTTPPAHRNFDSNGVDLVRGDYLLSFVEGSIGSGEAELALVRTAGSAAGGASQWDGIDFRLTRPNAGGAATATVTLAGKSERFTASGEAFASTLAMGSELTGSGGRFTYAMRDGTRVSFADPSGNPNSGATNFCKDGSQTGCTLLPTEISSPDGRTVTLDWNLNERCSGAFNPDGSLDCEYDWRLGAVSNNFGYSIAFSYATAAASGPPPASWYRRSSASFHNAHAGGGAQASVAYAYPSNGATEVTDMGGRLWRVSGGAIRRPGAAADTTIVSTDASGTVSAVAREGVTTLYSRSVSGNVATMIVTDALDRATTVVSDVNISRPTSITDPLGRTTLFRYDTAGRLTRVTEPEGNYTEYSRDGRGNVTRTEAVAKSGSGLPAIVTSASFPSSCAGNAACNLPTSTTDARGNRTDYDWDPSLAVLNSVTGPAPAPGAARPQIRYSYTPTEGAYRLTGLSQCQTASSCTGTADEVKIEIGYDSNGNIVSTSSGDGTGALTATSAMTYDALGDLLTVDGPLAGPADTTRFRYNAARELIGTVSPDPDPGSGPGQAGGPLRHRAVRNIYTNGLLTRVEQGNVEGQSDADWAGFSAAQAVETDYDANARPVTSRLVSGSTIHALTQTGYDPLGRPECSARRMNPAAFGALPGSACALGAEGSHGPDRIARTVYDAAGQVAQVKAALGTADEANEVTTTYTGNGLVQTVTDAENNKTTYEYDGHDRLAKTFYPVASPKGAGASNGADYEQLTYESLAGGAGTSGLVTAFRNRAGETIGFGHDALGRLTSKDRPGSEPDVAFGYDLLGRMISASQSGHALSFGYDALGRRLSETGPLGTLASQYDLAGRRTRLTWPDGFFVDYDHLVTGETTTIRENGAVSGIGVLASFAYDDLGRRIRLTRGNGAITYYEHDPVSRLEEMRLDLGGTTHDLTLGFSYNPASQIASTTRSNDIYAWTGHGSGTTATTADGLNRIANWVNALGYDSKGNVTSDGSYSYAYSSENLLTQLTNPAGTVQTSSTYSYDPLTRLAVIDSSNSALDAQIAYDGQEIVLEGLSDGRTRRYVFGPGMDEPLVAYLVTASGTSRNWLSADERGSTVAMSNDSGTPNSGAGRYDEYGAGAGLTRFQYTGQYWLGDSNLHYYRARIYDPRLGRFLQPDPIGYGAGMNLYAYVGGDPVNFTDPGGQCSFTLWGKFRHNEDWTVADLLETWVTQDTPCGFHFDSAPQGGGGEAGAAEAASEERVQLACGGPLRHLCKQILISALRPMAKHIAAAEARKLGLTIDRITKIGSGGRSGANVRNLVGPPNSVLGKPSGTGLWFTNSRGQVVRDLTFEGQGAAIRAKEVIPGRGFGPKQQLSLEEWRIWRGF